MRRLVKDFAPWMGLVVGLSGCHSPSVTAVSLNPHYCDHKWAFLYDPCKEPEGIPFYMPKPLLIIAKNFRNIEETKVGLTNSAPIPNFFDDQAKYADLNARTNFQGMDGNAATQAAASTSGAETFPTGDAKNLATVAPATIYSSGGAPISPGVVAPDGLKPDAFYTYHILFVPDLTQKYGLKIKGGAGEIRAAMNLVNGWQFTGLGPYYMKDSSTAQNTLSAGITANLAASGVADVVKAVASLKPGGTPTAKAQSGLPQGGAPLASLDVNKVKAVADALRELQPKFLTIPAYAEISIYEPYLSPEGTMEWKLVAEKSFGRTVMAADFTPAQVVDLLKSATVTADTTLPQPNGVNPNPVNPNIVHPNLVNPNPVNPNPVNPNPVNPNPVNPNPVNPDPVNPNPVNPNPVNPNPVNPNPAKTKSGVSAKAKKTGDQRLPPPLQGPSASLAPGTMLRRSSFHTPLPDDSKTDDAVVRTQGVAPGATAGSLDAAAVNALAGMGGATLSALSLSQVSAFGDPGNRISVTPNPIFDVKGLPANATIELRRNQQVVGQNSTGPMVVDPVQVRDDVGVQSAGTYTYEVVKTAPQPVASLGSIVVQVTKGTTTPTIPPPISPTLDPVTTGDVIASDMMTKFVSQLGAIASPRGAAPTTAPVPNVLAPTSPPSSGNQVTLNQFFGKTRFPNAATPQNRERFSLFHRKKRPTNQTVAMDGVDVPAAAIAAVKNPPRPGSCPRRPNSRSKPKRRRRIGHRPRIADGSLSSD